MSTGGDYPDFQKIVSWIGTPVVDLANTSSFNPNPQTFGPFALGNWRNLLVMAQITNGQASVELDYHIPAIDSMLTPVQIVRFLSGSFGYVVPNLGRILESVIVTATATNVGVGLVVAPTNLPVGAFADDGTHFSLSQIGVSIPHGGPTTVAFQGSGLPTYLSFHSNVYPLEVVVDEIDIFGTGLGIAYRNDTVNADFQVGILVPAGTAQFTVNNQTGGDATVTAAIPLPLPEQGA